MLFLNVLFSLSDAPANYSAGENVTSRRVTITVQAVYKDLVKKKDNIRKASPIMEIIPPVET
jgi:hypothetical protein